MPNDIKKPLGRWNIDYCNKKTNNKVDLSNEDHCGPCGQYAISKTIIDINKSKDHSDKSLVIYDKK
jgi:hypothetical protein